MKLKVNIDGSSDDCYLRTQPLYAKDGDFENGDYGYRLRSEYDKNLIKKYKK